MEKKRKKVDERLHNYFRMNKKSCNKLPEMMRPHIAKRNAVMLESISVNERLAMTLRYLATIRSFTDLQLRSYGKINNQLNST